MVPIGDSAGVPDHLRACCLPGSKRVSDQLRSRPIFSAIARRLRGGGDLHSAEHIDQQLVGGARTDRPK